ncbi:MAG: sulfotransferase [Oceanicaulis sp.]|nr:sulfotransferase [Oceanicaulis sp.]
MTWQAATARRLPEPVEQALELLHRRYPASTQGGAAGMPLAQLLERCWARAHAGPEPVRVVRQLACVGGTIFGRALQAQPNVVVLSEVDPYASRHHRRAAFAPTDLVHLAETATGGVDDTVREDVFRASLRALHGAYARRGARLIVRAHSHTRYCRSRDWSSRPGVTELVARDLPVRTLTLVRHPLDSWISLNASNWVHFQPGTLEEYAARYRVFLDQPHAGRVVKYEDVAADPDAWMGQVCAWLELSFNPHWQDHLPAIRLSGGSGRGGDVFTPRDRVPVPGGVAHEAAASPAYEQLCAQLGYNPDPAAPPLTTVDGPKDADV